MSGRVVRGPWAPHPLTGAAAEAALAPHRVALNEAAQAEQTAGADLDALAFEVATDGTISTGPRCAALLFWQVQPTFAAPPVGCVPVIIYSPDDDEALVYGFTPERAS